VKKLTLLLVMVSVNTFADSLNIPAISVPTGYDRVKTSTGATCESTVTSSAYMQTGFYDGNSEDERGFSTNDKGAFVSVIIPIGGAKRRVDCSRFATLELQARELEIEQLKLELEQMRAMNNTSFSE